MVYGDDLVFDSKGEAELTIDVESGKLATISPDEIMKRMKFSNIKMTNDLLDQGKSVDYFMGHYCNWEWMTSIGLWIKDDVVCAQVYHKLINPTFDEIIKQMRERMGNICVEMRETARFVANMASQNKPCMVALIADQSPTAVSRPIVANTDIKVSFRLVQGEEKAALADSTGMEVTQRSIA